MAHIMIYKIPVFIKAVYHGVEQPMQFFSAWIFMIVLIVHIIKIIVNHTKSHLFFILFLKNKF
jgi:hypothetical protein